jgi:hypothetical protein
MYNVADLTTSTTTAPTTPTPAASPRIKLVTPHGFAIDHPDPAIGEQLMATALGVTDRDAMDGILRQLVRASVSGERPDEVTVGFMLSMVKSIKPRDSIEAMLVAQMVSVHVMAMRCTQHVAAADEFGLHDGAAHGFSRLARTFAMQIEALNRHRSHGEPAITVQNVSVGDGGKAIVGNVTQHASLIVAEKKPASAARKTKGAGSRRRREDAAARPAAEA